MNNNTESSPNGVDLAAARLLLDAASVPANYGYELLSTNIGYICFDTAQGSEYVFFTDNEDVELLTQFANDMGTLTAEELAEHEAAPFVDNLIDSGIAGLYSATVVLCDKNNSAYWMGYWYMPGYLDRTQSFGPYATCVKLAHEMANYFEE